MVGEAEATEEFVMTSPGGTVVAPANIRPSDRGRRKSSLLNPLMLTSSSMVLKAQFSRRDEEDTTPDSRGSSWRAILSGAERRSGSANVALRLHSEPSSRARPSTLFWCVRQQPPISA